MKVGIVVGSPCPEHSTHRVVRIETARYWCRRIHGVGSYAEREHEHAILSAWDAFELVTFDPTMINESPWNRTDWSGEFVAINDRGQPAGLGDGGVALLAAGDVRPPDPKPSDSVWGDEAAIRRIQDERSAFVARVIAVSQFGEYISTVAGIALLKDGRYVAWESEIDVTGSGFHADAVGGEANILIAGTARAAWMALSEHARDELRFATLPSEAAIVMVLHDRYLELRNADPDDEDEDDDEDGYCSICGHDIGLESHYHCARCNKVTSMMGHEPNECDPAAVAAVIAERNERLDQRTLRELREIASASGELGDLAGARIMEMTKRWDLHYDAAEPYPEETP